MFSRQTHAHTQAKTPLHGRTSQLQRSCFNWEGGNLSLSFLLAKKRSCSVERTFSGRESVHSVPTSVYFRFTREVINYM